MAQDIVQPGSTQQVFDSFYQINLTVPADQWEIVLSWFRSICATEQIAQNFTGYVFIISNNTKINPLDLLNQLQGLTGIEIDAVMAFYLNNVKTKSALYGVANLLTPNRYVQRNIIQ